eukprot:scaffold45687_cov16-Tisochrysis_lutea.AAC.1
MKSKARQAVYSAPKRGRLVVAHVGIDPLLAEHYAWLKKVASPPSTTIAGTESGSKDMDGCWKHPALRSVLVFHSAPSGNKLVSALHRMCMELTCKLARNSEVVHQPIVTPCVRVNKPAAQGLLLRAFVIILPEASWRLFFMS